MAIADLSKWNPPQRRRTDGDGNIIVEKLSSLMHVMCIDPAGNEVPLPLANAISETNRSNPYRTQILPEKLRSGFVQIGLCPLGVTESIVHLPQSVRYATRPDGKPDMESQRGPCMKGAEGGKISATNPCKCIGALREVRQGRHAKLEDNRESRTNKLHKLAEQNAQANLDASTKMAQAAESLANAASTIAASGAKPAKGSADK